jgi:MFS superfamily sulfate permease-like transporter
LLAYSLFGPSRVLVLGPDSSLGPVIAATIAPLSGGGRPGDGRRLRIRARPHRRSADHGRGLLRLGFVADLLSRPTQLGYMNGLALTILISQLPKLCGFSVDADGLLPEACGIRAWPSRTARSSGSRWPSVEPPWC